jgi:hypothetical protein
MGAASAIWAAVHAHNDATAAAAGGASSLPAPPSPLPPPPRVAGLVLVILPTFYDARTRRKGQIVRAAERGFEAMAGRTRIRGIFEGSPRESEPPKLIGVRKDSFKSVMLGGADSDLPPPDVVAVAVASIPTLVLSWDCGDSTHPASSAAAFAELAPHARVYIARSLEDTAAWPGLIRDFVAGL